MLEPRWENSRFIADFRSVKPTIERFPNGCDENEEAFKILAQVLDDLHYQGYISSPNNSYQINLTFDQQIHNKMCLAGCECKSEPVLKAASEVADTVGRNADLLLTVPDTQSRVVVEIEKANREKILRDIVKMLLFFNSGQAALAALVCPRNYPHTHGVWQVFDTALQVLRTFIHVTQLPDSTTKRFAVIGFTQQIFLNGSWVHWDKDTRSDFQQRARKHFEDRPRRI